MRKKSNEEILKGVKQGKLKLLQLQWLDHSQIAVAAWRSREEVVELLADIPVINSVGWLIYEDDWQYIIAAVLDGEGHSRSEITIFKNCVVRKRVIK